MNRMFLRFPIGIARSPPDSPGRQGEVLRELARFDPALEAHPQIDRHLLSKPSPDSAKTAPHYDQLTLESARRRAFFEWTQEDISSRSLASLTPWIWRGDGICAFSETCRLRRIHRSRPSSAHVCAAAFRVLKTFRPKRSTGPDVVPLRITPRTPTETAFWVEKPLTAFRLEADLPPEAEGVERLHRQAFLIYRYRDGREERLRLGAELFHLLLELSDGYQLGDVSTDDTFAHLSIFVQRLVREDERELLAWNPMQDDVIYRVSAWIEQTADGLQQRMILSPLTQEGRHECRQDSHNGPRHRR